jgi:BirA family biotin operon repressor/biotin-[acetyl-CoA-carboxylase] ligase
MTINTRALLEALADGEFHSGEQLARSAGVSRTAIWKHLRGLSASLDLELHSVRGRGHRLARSIELLEKERITDHIHKDNLSCLGALEVFDSLPSTSAYLVEKRQYWNGESRICFAEHQTSGRGRRGRGWVSPFGSNLYFSLHWTFDLPLTTLGGLSLASGVAVARTLESIGLPDATLKWPNDLHAKEHKIGGLLVEGFGPTEGPVSVVIGVGVNHDMPDDLADSIDQPWIDLKRAVPGIETGRNELAGLLANELLNMARVFSSDGWAAFRDDWERYDNYRGRSVEVHASNDVHRGIYRGVDDSGGMVLDTGSSRMVFHSGEISLRVSHTHG